MTPTSRVREAAAARGLDIEVLESPRASSLEEAAELRGITPADIVKTLVVKGRGEDNYLFALIPGDRSISWPKLRALLGVNKLRLPEPDLALQATGYERGTITPLGSTHAWPVIADERITGTISIGGGDHGVGITVDAGALAKALNATVADVTD